jgi:hypothetical protein
VSTVRSLPLTCSARQQVGCRLPGFDFDSTVLLESVLLLPPNCLYLGFLFILRSVSSWQASHSLKWGSKLLELL